MALKWADTPTMVVKMNVATNADGNIATGEDTAVGQKTVSMPGIKTTATFPQADQVYGTILTGILGTTYDKKTATRVITGGVVEDGE